MQEKLHKFYANHYKKLFFVPILLVLLFVIVIGLNVEKQGDFIQKDISLGGGTTATVSTSQSFPMLEEDLAKKLPAGSFSVQVLKAFGTDTQVGFVVEVTSIEPDKLKSMIEEVTGLQLTDENLSIEFVSGSLGESFYKQMLIAIVLALVFMAVVVFVTFRVFVPSIAVVFAAVGDMLGAVAVADLLGMRLSTGAIAAILLLIGYSIDTDILLTTWVLKRREGGVLFDRLYQSIKTGLTMTAATVAALTVGYLLTTSPILKQMFFLIVVGLLFDVVMTYGMNAGLLVWYAKKKGEEL